MKETKTKSTTEAVPGTDPGVAESQSLAVAGAMTGALVMPGDDVPEFLRDVKGQRGLENITEQDVNMPRVVLCQALSPQRKKNDPKYIEGLDEGDFFNNVTGEVYGDTFTFTPILMFKNKINFRPMDEGGGIVCRSQGNDQKCPLNNMGQCTRDKFVDGEKPECTQFYNWLAMIHPTGQLAAISFKSSAIGQAKNLNMMVKLTGKDAFASKYTVRSKDKTNDSGTFKVPVVAPAGWSSKEQYQAGELIYTRFRDAALTIDVSDVPGEATGSSTDTDEM